MSSNKLKLMSARILVALAFGLVALTGPSMSGPGVALAARAASDDDHDRANTQLDRLHDLQAAFHFSVSYNGDPNDRADHLEFLETLWAEDATITVGGVTRQGRDAVMDWFANSAGPFIQNHHWASLTPAFRTQFDVDGNTADISYVCILVDPATDKVMAKTSFSGTAKKVRGNWVFWHITVAPATL